MAFTVELFTFSKKENSTKQPVRSNAASFNCVLKKDSGILNPRIELNIGLNAAPASYNYAYIPSFNRYYWITEWTNEHPLWVAHLKVDELASYKSSIGDSDLYILRASEDYNGNIIDSMYPATTATQTSRITGNRLIPDCTLDTGMFVIGVVSKGATWGSIQYYCMPYMSLARLISALLDDSTLTSAGFNNLDASLPLQKSLIDPLSYIKSAMFVPYDYNTYGGTASNTLNVWDWNLTGIANKPLLYNSYTFSNTIEIDIPKHPQAASRGNYCNCAPYSEYTLNAGIFGIIELDPVLLRDATKISIRVIVDMITGIGRLEAWSDISNPIYLTTQEKQVCVPIQLSQVTRDYVAMSMNNFNTITGIASNLMAGDIGGVIESGVNGIANGIKARVPKQNTIGNTGSFMSLLLYPMLEATFYNIVSEDNDHNGRPLCAIRKPSTLGGYMKIQDGDIPITGTSQEANAIRSYLEGGFYYE